VGSISDSMNPNVSRRCLTYCTEFIPHIITSNLQWSTNKLHTSFHWHNQVCFQTMKLLHAWTLPWWWNYKVWNVLEFYCFKKLSICKWQIVCAFCCLIIVDFSLCVWKAEMPVFIDIKYPFFRNFVLLSDFLYISKSQNFWLCKSCNLDHTLCL